jgi:hypothetical protein
MAGTWTPTAGQLGQVYELASVAYAIDYQDLDELGTPLNYKVAVTALETNPPTISVYDNKIIGYYKDSFLNKDLQHFTYDETYVNTNTFGAINIKNMQEMIYYHADPTRSITYSYRADAYAPTDLTKTIVATATFTITVLNNWTNGELQLIEFVKFAKEKPKQVAYWANAEFTTKTGTAVSWEPKI